MAINSSISVLRFGLDWLTLNFPRESATCSDFDGYFKGFGPAMAEKIGVFFCGTEFRVTFSQIKTKKILWFDYLGDRVMCMEWLAPQPTMTKQETSIAQHIEFRIIFYGTFFYITDLRFCFRQFIESLGTPRTYFNVSRIDLALDIDLSMEALLDNYKNSSSRVDSRTIKTLSGKQGLETIYLGTKSNQKRHFIRVYDKKKQVIKSKKYHLYMGYSQYKGNVSRIELQANVKTAKTMHINSTKLLELYDAQNGLKTELWKEFCRHAMNKQSIDFGLLELQYDERGIWKNEQSQVGSKFFTKTEMLDEMPYAKTVISMINRLQRMGFDMYGHVASKRREFIGLEEEY